MRKVVQDGFFCCYENMKEKDECMIWRHIAKIRTEKLNLVGADNYN